MRLWVRWYQERPERLSCTCSQSRSRSPSCWFCKKYKKLLRPLIRYLSFLCTGYTYLTLQHIKRTCNCLHSDAKLGQLHRQTNPLITFIPSLYIITVLSAHNRPVKCKQNRGIPDKPGTFINQSVVFLWALLANLSRWVFRIHFGICDDLFLYFKSL